MSDQVVSRRGALFAALLLGAGVAVALGVYGRVHEPASYASMPTFGFSSTGHLQGLDRHRGRGARCSRSW